MHQFHPLGSPIPERNEMWWDRFPRNWWEILKPYKEKVTISELPFGGTANIYDANAIIDIEL